MMLAEFTGNIHIGLAFGGAAIGIGIAAAGGVMAIGRTPGAFGKVFTTIGSFTNIRGVISQREHDKDSSRPLEKGGNLFPQMVMDSPKNGKLGGVYTSPLSMAPWGEYKHHH